MKKYSKKWYLKQNITVGTHDLWTYSLEDKKKVLIDNLPYGFTGPDGMSVTDIYMKGWKNLMWVLEFRESQGECGNVLVHPVLIFMNPENNTFYFKQIHSEQEFLNIAGKRNYKRWWKFTHLRSPISELD